MATSTPTLYAYSGVIISMTLLFTYLMIGFTMGYIVAWGLTRFIRGVLTIISHD